jgi:hypothetical protein
MVSFFRRFTVEHFEFQASLWYFIASAGYVTYDIIFGFFVLYCASDYCNNFNGRPTAAFESNFLTVFWAVAYLGERVGRAGLRSLVFSDRPF